MKSMMWKSTLREVNKSFGRFIAILAIVALGVSLFAGLKAVRPSMVKTTRDFLTDKAFYDYRILSTLGYEEQDVEQMRNMADVRAAEGAVSFDVLCSLEDGNEMVLKTHSITENINRPVLKKGRMPERADECVLDALMFSEDVIGQKLLIADSAENKDAENFVYREYTVTGIVQSPLYIQFERGNTSLGNGRITGFVYLLSEGFAVDYYTEVYVKFRDDFNLYSEEYDAYLEEKESDWEGLAQSLALARYENIKSEAETEIADARKKLADGEAELADAAAKLEEARTELADGERKLQEAEQELADAKITLEEKEQELADARETLASEEQKLADGETEITENRRLLQEKKAELERGKAELDANQYQLSVQISALAADKSKLEAAEAFLLQQEKAIEEQEALLGTPLTQAREQLEQAKQELSANHLMLERAEDQLAAYQSQLDEGYAELDSGTAQLQEAERELEEAEAKLHDGKSQLANAKTEIAQGEIKLEEGRAEIAEAETDLARATEDLADGRKEYEEGLAEYEEGLLKFREKSANAEIQLADAQEALSELEEPDSFVLGRDTNIGYVCFESDSAIVDGIADVFPVFFFAVAALVCVTTMNRMVEEQRTQIGVLKALGYSRGAIMCKYLFYSGTAAAVGCLIGFLGGTWLFPKVIWFAYGILYQVDELQYVFDGKLAVISFGVSMLCSMGATWASCRKELSEVAAQLMRPKAPKAGQRVFLERVPFVWKRLKFLHKVSVRNVFRYKKRFFMMVIGICGCTALLVAGFGIRDSIMDVAHHQYERIQIFDLAVTCTGPVSQEEEAVLEEVLGENAEGYLTVLETSAELVTEGAVKPLYLVAAGENTDISPYLNLFDQDGNHYGIPGPGECIITEKTARQYGIGIGDTVTLRDDEMRSMELTVSGIIVNYIYTYAYISCETYEQILGETVPAKTVYVNLSADADAYRVSADLMKQENVASVTVNRDMLERFDSMLSSMNLIVVVIVLCAAGLAFIVLYNLTNINITERIREIATIKVLGFYKKETASYVFRENLVLTFIGALAGLVLGKFFHRFVMRAVEVDVVSFDVHIKPVSYVYSFLLTIAFAWFVNLVMRKKLDRVSMTESLKSVD